MIWRLCCLCLVVIVDCLLCKSSSSTTRRSSVEGRINWCFVLLVSFLCGCLLKLVLRVKSLGCICWIIILYEIICTLIARGARSARRSTFSSTLSALFVSMMLMV